MKYLIILYIAFFFSLFEALILKEPTEIILITLFICVIIATLIFKEDSK